MHQCKSEWHNRHCINSSGNSDHRISRLGSDLIGLSDVWRNKESIEFGTILKVIQSSIYSLLPRTLLAELECLPVCIVHDTASGKGGNEPILARTKGWIDSWCTAFGAEVVDIVLY